jgi:hypothetical protein
LKGHRQFAREAAEGKFNMVRQGGFSKALFSCKSVHTMRHMRRATIIMAVLAFLPRSRCAR